MTCSIRAESARKGGMSARHVDLKGMAGQGLLDAVDGRVDQVGRVAPVEPGPEGAGFEAGLVEQIVDEPGEAAGRRAHLRHQAVAQGPLAPGEVFGHRAEDGQRGLELVRDPVQQGAVELLGLGQQLLALPGGPQVLALDQKGDLAGEPLDQVALGQAERGVRLDPHDQDAQGRGPRGRSARAGPRRRAGCP